MVLGLGPLMPVAHGRVVAVAATLAPSGGWKKRYGLTEIGILSDPVSLLENPALARRRCLVVGTLAGALAWRKRRWAGALLGAVIGFAAWLAGWMWVKDVI